MFLSYSTEHKGAAPTCAVPFPGSTVCSQLSWKGHLNQPRPNPAMGWGTSHSLCAQSLIHHPQSQWLGLPPTQAQHSDTFTSIHVFQFAPSAHPHLCHGRATCQEPLAPITMDLHLETLLTLQVLAPPRPPPPTACREFCLNTD